MAATVSTTTDSIQIVWQISAMGECVRVAIVIGFQKLLNLLTYSIGRQQQFGQQHRVQGTHDSSKQPSKIMRDCRVSSHRLPQTRNFSYLSKIFLFYHNGFSFLLCPTNNFHLLRVAKRTYIFIPFRSATLWVITSQNEDSLVSDVSCSFFAPQCSIVHLTLA